MNLDDQNKKLDGYVGALLRALQMVGVKFVRYQTLDAVNNPRIKCVPLSYLLQQYQRHQSESQQQSTVIPSSTTTATSTDAIAACSKTSFWLWLETRAKLDSDVLAGLPSFGDNMKADSDLDAPGTLVMEPDFATLRILPYAPPEAVVLCNVRDYATGQLSDLCCRSLLQRVVQEAAVAHSVGFNVGVKVVFNIFHAKTNEPVDATSFAHSSLPNTQHEFLFDLQKQLVEQEAGRSDGMGIVELVHAESGHGQLEVVLSSCHNDPVLLCDRVFLARETIQVVAHQHGLKAVFLPRIDTMRAGTGCHLHLSLCDLSSSNPSAHNNCFGASPSGAVDTTITTTTNETTQIETFATSATAPTGISPLGQSFMEGILVHLPALLWLTTPTTNSFRRTGPGCWTGSTVHWSYNDKEAPIQVVYDIAKFSSGGGASALNDASGATHCELDECVVAKYVEFKLCDHTANLYLALAGILACGVHGIKEKATLRPHRFNASSLSQEGRAQNRASSAAALAPASWPQTLDECLDSLEQDEILVQTIPKALLQGYLALGRAETSQKAEVEEFYKSIYQTIVELPGRAFA